MLLVAILVPSLAVILLAIIIAPLVTYCVAKYNKRRFVELLLKNASDEDRKVVAGNELRKLGYIDSSAGQGGPPDPNMPRRKLRLKRDRDLEAIDIVNNILTASQDSNKEDLKQHLVSGRESSV